MYINDDDIHADYRVASHQGRIISRKGDGAYYFGYTWALETAILPSITKRSFNIFQGVSLMKISKTVATMMLAGAAGAFALTAPTSADAKLKRITIGSNPAGTMYFVLAGAFSKLFQEKLGLRANAQPHAGSSVYLPLLDKGEITMGLNSSLDSAMGFNARPPYAKATKNVRTIARVWTLPYAYFVRNSSGMKTIADLRGKDVQVNIKSNVSLGQLNRTLLATAGLTMKDVNAKESGGIVQGINMVVEGRVDAAVTALGIPVLLKAHAGIPGGIRILSLGPKASDEFMHKGMEGARTLTVKPSKRFVGVKGPTKIAAFETYLNISGNVSNEDAYIFAKTLHQNWKALNKDYGATRSVKVNAMAPPINPIPYHAGAIKYYKEAGIWSAENDKHQMMLK
jgi:hypothetical protein